MPEKNLIVDGKEINYEGVFDLNKLLRTFDQLFAEKGYARKEKKREEKVTSDGKEFFIELRPVKPMAAYYVHNIVIKIYATDVKDVFVNIHGRKLKIHEGKVRIVFNSWELTDYWLRWEQTAWYSLLKGFFEKFFFNLGSTKHMMLLKTETDYIYNNIKAHLNLYKFIVK